jgi:hypothetical protein
VNEQVRQEIEMLVEEEVARRLAHMQRQINELRARVAALEAAARDAQ